MGRISNDNKINQQIEVGFNQQNLDKQLEEKINFLIEELEFLSKTTTEEEINFYVVLDNFNKDLGINYNFQSGQNSLKDVLTNLTSSLREQPLPINSTNSDNFKRTLCLILQYFQFLELNGIRFLKEKNQIFNSNHGSLNINIFSSYPRKLVRIRRIWSLCNSLNDLDKLRKEQLIINEQIEIVNKLANL